MRPLDWAVLLAALAGIVLYGVWKGRRTRDLDDFLRRRPPHALAPRRALHHGDAGERHHLPRHAGAGVRGRHALRAGLPRPARRDGHPLGDGRPHLPPAQGLHRLRVPRRPLRLEDAHARRAPLPRAARTLDRRLALRAVAHPLGHHGLGHPRRHLHHRRRRDALRLLGRRAGRGQHELPPVPHHHGRDVRRLLHHRPAAAAGRVVP